VEGCGRFFPLAFSSPLRVFLLSRVNDHVFSSSGSSFTSISTNIFSLLPSSGYTQASSSSLVCLLDSTDQQSTDNVECQTVKNKPVISNKYPCIVPTCPYYGRFD
jgi:hypothetical protein